MSRLRFVAPILLALLAGCADPAVDGGGTAPPSGGTNPAGVPARLLRIFDGDSMEVEIDGSVVEVRMAGINAPERDECHGDAAREALVALVGDGPLVVEDSDDGIDQYGRVLAYLWVDGVEVNERVLELGHAVALSDGNAREPVYRAAALDAMTHRIGMWDPDACGPSVDPAVEIGPIEFDPPGRDEANPLREYIDIRNTGTTALDMSGWTLRDESTQHRYRFGAVTIAPGESVRIRSGCGEDRGLDLVWCAADPVWNNGGDTVIVQDEHGNVVAWETYDGDF